MDLADRVIQANEQAKGYETDELGLGIADTPDYITARIMYRNTLDREKDPSAPLLHTRAGRTELWLGNNELPLTTNTLYRLSAIRRNIKPFEVQLVWESLMKHLPALDMSKIAVSPHYYWDTETGELCYSEEEVLGV